MGKTTMNLTNPSEYTKKFLELDFTPYRDLVDDSKFGDKLTNNSLPIVEISGFDTDVLKKLYDHAVSVDYKVPITQNQYYWYSQKHSDKWTQYVIKHNDRQKYATFLGDAKDCNPPVDDDGTALALVEELFQPYELTITNARFGQLAPGGYLCPHMDIFETDPGMCYFWMPLHDVSPSLKIFPYGWHKPKVGSLYLFNFTKWIHAIHNYKTESRFILGGRFDLKNVSEKLLVEFRRNKDSFQNDFENFSWDASTWNYDVKK